MVYPVPGGDSAFFISFSPRSFEKFEAYRRVGGGGSQYNEYLVILFHLDASTVNVLLHFALSLSLSLSSEPFES